MKKVKYIITMVFLSVMLFVCVKAISVNLNTSKAKPKATSSYDVLKISAAPNDSKSENSSLNDFSLQTTEPAAETTDTPTSAPEPTPVSIIVTPTPKPISTPAPVIQSTLAPTDAVVVTATPISVTIPTILTPSASGTEIFSSASNEAVIDASNINQGYVAIKYSGSNAKVKVQISANNNTYNYDLPSSGEYIIYPLQFGNGSYTVSVLENISGTQYMSILSKSLDVSIADSSLPFLYPNQYVWFTQHSYVVQKSAELCAGLNTNIEKISAIFKYVTTNITYDYVKADSVKTGYLPDVDNILSIKKGICFDYAAVFAAMCRAQGIPTKLVTGYVSPNGLYHAWNEVYSDEKGWITVSFYLDKIGFNLVDATFYANMSDGNEAASYIGNASNYQTYHIY